MEKNWAKNMKRHFIGEDTQTNIHMRESSPLVAIREMQLKTTVRYQCTPVRTGEIRK